MCWELVVVLVLFVKGIVKEGYKTTAHSHLPGNCHMIKLGHILLLDIKMPGMDGFEVYNKMKEIGGDLGNTEVIFLASDSSDDSEIKGLSLGAIDYIKKPFRPEILKLRINHTLELVMLRKKYRINK